MRLAVAPFENLSGDGSLDWVGAALAEVVSSQLAGSAEWAPVRVGGAADPASAAARMMLSGYFTGSGDRLRLKVQLEDLTTRRVSKVYAAGRSRQEGVIELGGAVARWLDPQAAPYETRNLKALRALSEGRLAASAKQAAAAFERAVIEEPGYGAAWAAWVQTLLASGDRSGAKSVLDKAKAQGERLPPRRRAELAYLDAVLMDDRGARRKALSDLVRFSPADAGLLRLLAAEETAAGDFGGAADHYRKACSLDPADPVGWNQLGYAEARRKNLAAAAAALQEYVRLAPGEANPLDSLGDVHYFLGSFADAEKHYLAAYEKDPRFLGGATLYKAARARLMTGDIAGADGLFRRYFEARSAAGDVLAGYVRAQWLYLTGRRREGVEAMQKLASGKEGASEAALLAKAQLAAWALGEGDRRTALELSSQALELGRSPLVRTAAALCRTAAGAPPEGAASTQPLVRLGMAYGSLLEGRYREAANLLEKLAAEADPLGAEQAHILLAWALLETGREAEAAPLVETFGLPQAGVEPVFGYLTFPRIFVLRSRVLEMQGRKAEAARAKEIAQKLSGGLS